MSTVAAAVAGRGVPSWEVTSAVAVVCGLHPETTSTLWRAARAEREGYLGSAGPESAASTGEFVHQVLGAAAARCRVVALVRAIAAGTGLSRSAVGRALKGDVAPAAAGLAALGVAAGVTLAGHTRGPATGGRPAAA